MLLLKKKNSVFIGTSLDNYIADHDDNIDWLDMIPNPDQDDMGYYDFMTEIDAIVMGRTSFEKVLSFGVDWPYHVPVFVLSNTWKSLPSGNYKNATLLSGDVTNVLNDIHEKGYGRLYIDGGKTIQAFLKKDLIDEMTITHLPILLGGGYPLFGEHTKRMEFLLEDTKTYLEQIVQRRYVRKRE